MSGIHVPPFSPQYHYTFKEKTTEQGAGKIISNRAEIEMLEWLNHREKQGMMHQLTNFLGCKLKDIGKQGEWQKIT